MKKTISKKRFSERWLGKVGLRVVKKNDRRGQRLIKKYAKNSSV